MHRDSQGGSEPANSSYQVRHTRSSACARPQSTSAQLTHRGARPHGRPRIATPSTWTPATGGGCGGRPHGRPRIATPTKPKRGMPSARRWAFRAAEDRNWDMVEITEHYGQWRSPSGAAEDRNWPSLQREVSWVNTVAVAITGGRRVRSRRVHDSDQGGAPHGQADGKSAPGGRSDDPAQRWTTAIGDTRLELSTTPRLVATDENNQGAARPAPTKPKLEAAFEDGIGEFDCQPGLFAAGVVYVDHDNARLGSSAARMFQHPHRRIHRPHREQVPRQANDRAHRAPVTNSLRTDCSCSSDDAAADTGISTAARPCSAVAFSAASSQATLACGSPPAGQLSHLDCGLEDNARSTSA